MSDKFLECFVIHHESHFWHQMYTFLSSLMRATCPAHLNLLDLICLIIFEDSTNYEAPHCATSPILLSLHPSLVQILSLGPCSETASVCALPLMWETKFHTHTKNWQNRTPDKLI
jgi:hypothetical protein